MTYSVQWRSLIDCRRYTHQDALVQAGLHHDYDPVEDAPQSLVESFAHNRDDGSHDVKTDHVYSFLEQYQLAASGLAREVEIV